MRKVVILIMFSLFGSSLYAQNSLNSQQNQLTGPSTFVSPNIIQTPNFSRTFENQIIIPSDISPQNRAKIQDLIIKIQNVCPTCSTVGVIGGGVMQGALRYDSSAQDLFPKGTISVKESEYKELKRKAALYDMYRSQYEELKRKAALYDKSTKKK
jgi:hypothetical protein